jgi:hypothetical protein
LVIGSAASASASPLTEALARHSDKDVAALRGRADLASRCTLGAVYAQRDHLSLASLYLRGCAEAELPTEIAGAIAKIDRDLQKKLRDSDLARIEVVTNPAGMTATITAFPGESFTTPATLYLVEGDYDVEATQGGLVLKNVVHAVKRSRGAVVLDAGGAIGGGKITKDGSVDFAEEGGGGGEQHAGPPPAVRHKNLMNEKYQRGFKAVATAESNSNALEDPFAIRQQRRASRPFWLGLRLGGGMFDDGASRARAGVAVAATGRVALASSTFLAGRLDWSRRGGDSIDTLGASAGAGVSVVDGVAVLAQLRGDLRFGDMAERAGVTAAVGVEASLPRSPFSAGVRFEQGLTTLIAGARDRAVLLELGVDWR